MKIYTLYILFLSLVAIPLQAISLCCGDSYIITQPDMPYTIEQEGSYCLAESVTGKITVNADQVILDLAGKSISQSDINIDVQGQSDVIIRNGRVKDALNIGINVEDATNILLQDLDFIANDMGVLISTSTGIVVDHCTFRNQSTNALTMQNINSGHITDSLFQQNHGSAIVQLDNGAHITCKNLDVIENICDTGSVSSGIVATYVNDSDFIGCKINSNKSITNSTFSTFLLNSCTNVRVYNCIANNNESASVFIGFGVSNNTAIDFSKQIIFDSCIANSNYALQNGIFSIAIGFLLQSGQDIGIINSIVHDNRAIGQSVGVINLGASDVVIKNNSVVNNIGGQGSSGIVLLPNDVAWANEVHGHTQDFTGSMPKVTYDALNGIFKIYGTNTPTTPTCYDNIGY